MIIVSGTVRLPSERLAAAKAHMQAMIAASRAEEGCLSYAYAQDVLDPDLIHVVEHWCDREALKAHFQTPHMLVWRAAFAEMGVTDRNLVSFEAGDSQPL